MRGDWRRYAAPAAFLLAATVAVVLVRSGVDAGRGSPSREPTVPATTRKQVATTTAAAPRRRAATARRFWTVAAGDSFGVIASKSGVPVATIERLNPGVSSTSLVVGQKVRIR